MIEAIHVHATIEKDGEISLSGLPFKKGQSVEMIVLSETPAVSERVPLTARQLLNSGLIGLWKARSDIGDSTAYARRLREQAERRSRG